MFSLCFPTSFPSFRGLPIFRLVSLWRSEVMFDEPLLLHVVLVRGRSLGEKDMGVGQNLLLSILMG